MENLPKLINLNDNSTININSLFFSIGRSLTCNMVIESLGVSRVHCFIRRNHPKYSLIDRSTNGTIVNGKVITFNDSIELKHNDLIQFGTVTYQFIDDNITKSLENHQIDDKQNQPTTSTIIVNNNNNNNNNNDNDNNGGIEETSSFGTISSETSLTSTNITEITDELLPVAEEFEIPFDLNCITNNNNNNNNNNDDDHNNGKLNKSDDNNVMDTELSCSICSELFIKAVTLTCSHSFCKFCIDEWIKNKKQCPICRQRITVITPTIVLDNLIERIILNRPKEEQEQRQQQIKQRQDKSVAGPSNQRKRRRLSQQQQQQQHDDEQPTTVDDTTIHILSDEDDDDDDHDEDYDDDIFHDTSMEYFDEEHDDDDDDDEDFDDYDETYTGLPGHYYGGYGRCYICRDRGHWANGCPFKSSH